MEELIKILRTDDCIDAARKIETNLKNKLHGAEGLIKKYRKEGQDPEVKNKYKELKYNLLPKTNVDNMDQMICEYVTGLKEINDSVQEHIKYKLINHIYEYQKDLFSRFPNSVKVVLSLTKENNLIPLEFFRLSSIFSFSVASSIGNDNKSRAGNAGESFVNFMLEAINMEKDTG